MQGVRCAGAKCAMGVRHARCKTCKGGEAYKGVRCARAQGMQGVRHAKW